jgi:hypothetical protein
MLNHVGFNEKYRNGLWTKSVSTAMKLRNILAGKDGKTPLENFHGHTAKYGRYLIAFGEIFITVDREKFLGRLKN